MVEHWVKTMRRVGGFLLMVLSLLLHTAVAQGQSARPARKLDRRLTVEGAAGLQTYYVGSTLSAALGFAPTRHLTLLVGVEHADVQDKVEPFDDGYAFERGGTETFVSGALRYTFLSDRHVSPYVVGGMGRGRSRSSVNEFFPEPDERNISTVFYGGGVRIPVTPWINVFADGRVVMMLEGASDYFRVRLPIRGGIAWRF